MAVYACSDLHGRLDAYEEIKEYINPDDIIYCLGDCGDRGYAPWDTIKTVYLDPQFIYLKGNHEDMLVNALKEKFDSKFSNTGHWQRLLHYNGGMGTFDDFCTDAEFEHTEPMAIIKKLEELPLTAIYTNTQGQKILLCHAGCNWGNTLPSEEKLLWSRSHFLSPSERTTQGIVVHGHTPIPYLAEYLEIDPPLNEALKYADGKKYCIDAGTVFTNKALLLNLDTFESISFNLKDYN